MLRIISLNHLDNGEAKENYYKYLGIRDKQDTTVRDYKESIKESKRVQLDEEVLILLNNNINKFIYCIKSGNINKLLDSATFNSIKRRYYSYVENKSCTVVYVIFAVTIVGTKLSCKVLSLNNTLTDDFSKIKFMSNDKVAKDFYNKLTSRKTRTICGIVTLSDIM